tara:strand:+ start:245 stop:709 length:465 start_codon:yes stop_codon:yes gene_type:complete
MSLGSAFLLALFVSNTSMAQLQELDDCVFEPNTLVSRHEQVVESPEEYLKLYVSITAAVCPPHRHSRDIKAFVNSADIFPFLGIKMVGNYISEEGTPEVYFSDISNHQQQGYFYIPWRTEARAAYARGQTIRLKFTFLKENETLFSSYLVTKHD